MEEKKDLQTWLEEGAEAAIGAIQETAGAIQTMARYEDARQIYAKAGISTEDAINRLMKVPVSLHCWQGDDVRGFDTDPSKPLTGGIQTTGNYPGRARTPEELMADYEKVLSLCPGKKKLNLHASYAIFDEGEYVDRDKLEPKHFAKWVEFAKKNKIGLDFNPTFFSHPNMKNGLTLSSPDEENRKFWIEHGKACVRIASYFARETGIPCVMNIWIGDGYKDIPADRKGPRERYKDSIEQIIAEEHDPKMVKITVESKVFGIGVESYTAGSAEFTLLFAATHPGILPLMDNGHYHPTEFVSDKISSLLCYFDEIALHITRPVRWDSDHVVILDDETKEIAKEIVRNGDSLERINIALDYFDASINRIAAWTVGFRSLQKALLMALLTPNEELKKLQDTNQLTKLMARQEEIKTYPFGDIWAEYLSRCGAPGEAEWFAEVEKYEKEVLANRE